jgi:hypothetical protein
MFKIIFLTLSIYVILFSFSYAEILDLSNIRQHDEFIDLGRKVSGKGFIYISLEDEFPVINATYYSKLPPHVIISLFNDYLKEKGINEQLMRCPYGPKSIIKMGWMGMLDGTDKQVCIFYTPSMKDVSIMLSSSKNGQFFQSIYRSLAVRYPEIKNFGGNIINSHEEIKGNVQTGVFVYEVPANPKSAFEKAIGVLEHRGWKVEAKAEDQYTCTINKKNTGAMLIATPEGGGTYLVCTVTAGL